MMMLLRVLGEGEGRRWLHRLEKGRVLMLLLVVVVPVLCRGVCKEIETSRREGGLACLLAKQQR